MISRHIKLAAAAVVTLAVMLPVSYGAVKAIQKYLFEDRVTFEYPKADGRGSTAYMFGRTIGVGGTDPASRDAARAKLEEFFQLYQEGKATQVGPDVWQATLASGEQFAYKGDPTKDHGAEFTEEEKAQLKQMADEINELRQAGKGERTFWKEIEDNGMRVRLYRVRYTLASGKVAEICEGEPAAEK